jgi:hypothetical protein
MVYDTEEGARAHLDEVKGMGSTSLAPSDVASYEVKQVDAEPNRTYDPSLGGNKFQPLGSTRKTADAYQEAVRRGMMMGTSEFINPGAMLPSSVYVVMEPGPNGARPTDRKTTDRAEANRWAEELLARTDWSPYTSSLDAEHTPARRSAAASGQTCDYDSGSMYGNTHRCGQPATHVVTHSGGSGPMMKTPVCDRHKGSMAGRYPFDSTKVEKIARTLDTAFASLADDIKRQFDKENPSTTDGCDICGDSGHTTAQHEADPRRTTMPPAPPGVRRPPTGSRMRASAATAGARSAARARTGRGCTPAPRRAPRPLPASGLRPSPTAGWPPRSTRSPTGCWPPTPG